MMNVYVRFLDDGSILVEWKGDHFRVGFSIEPTISDSSWYIVSDSTLDYISECGYLFRKNLIMNTKQNSIIVQGFAKLSRETIKVRIGDDALIVVTEGIDFSSTPNKKSTAKNIANAIRRKIEESNNGN